MKNSKHYPDNPTKPRSMCLDHDKLGRCHNNDAPNPGHSWCIGTKSCGSYRKDPGILNEGPKL